MFSFSLLSWLRVKKHLAFMRVNLNYFGFYSNSFSSEIVDKKIEEFLSSFEEKIENLTEDAFNTQVTDAQSVHVPIYLTNVPLKPNVHACHAGTSEWV